jgi:hypothetical protein
MDAIRERIRKLLALGDSPEEHEAAAALRLAQRLMERHAIDEASARGCDPAALGAHGETRFDFTPRIPRWRRTLLEAIGRAHGCIVYKHAGVLRYAGRERDRAQVAALYSELALVVEGLASRNAMGLGRAYADSYRRGVVATLAREIRAAQAEARAEAAAAGAQQSALVAVDGREGEAEAWAHAQYPGAWRQVTPRPASRGDAFAAGKRDGSGVYGRASRTRLGGARALLD